MNPNVKSFIHQLNNLSTSYNKFSSTLYQSLSGSPIVPPIALLFLLARLIKYSAYGTDSWKEIVDALHLKSPEWTSELIQHKLMESVSLWQNRCGISTRKNLTGSPFDQLVIGDEELSIRWALFVDNDVFGSKDKTLDPLHTQDPLFITEALPFSKYPEKAIKRINEYLLSISTGKWKTFLETSQADKDTNVLIYGLGLFRGTLAYHFPNSDIEEEHPFYMIDEATSGKDATPSRKVPLMVRRNCVETFGLHKWTKELQFRSITLTFSQSRFSLLYLQPEKNTTQQLELIEEAVFNPDNDENIFSKILREQQKTILRELKVPKGIFNFERDLSSALKSMDITRLFMPSDARIDAISPNAYVSKIFFKFQFYLDEEGAYPAPSSLDNSNKKPKKSPKKKGNETPDDIFICNRPFIMILFNTTTEVPLLISKYMDPNEMYDNKPEEEF